MRCFFMQSGKIANVAFLHEGSDDALIAEAAALFEAKREELKAEGFEVWDHARFVYRYPGNIEKP